MTNIITRVIISYDIIFLEVKMPKSAKITREMVIDAAVSIVREEGASALNARAVAERLSSSVQPIFYNFSGIDELRREVIAEAGRLYAARIEAVIAENKYPTYKSSGMAYVEFAIEERELFKLLFMRDRSAAERADDEALEPIYSLIAESVGVDVNTAKLIHLEIWAFVHGIAAMIVTDYYVPDIELIDSMMTDIYMGLKSRFGGAK